MGCAGSAPRPNAGPTSATLGEPTKPQALGEPTKPQTQLTASEAVELSLHGEAEGVHLASTSAPSASRSLGKYFTLDGLMEPVESGAIAPIKGSWLVAQHERGGIIAKRQEMPPEAFWTAAELRAIAEALGDDYGYLFVALSYRWLSKEHPDLQGFQLGVVAAVMRMYLGSGGQPIGTDYCSPPADKSPLSWAFEKAGLHLSGEWGSNEAGASLGDCAVFWDCPSLFQPPRTEEQTRLFGAGLKASNVWYGHQRSVCWMQSELPDGFEGAAYETSGWCFVEAAISAVIKPAGNRLDLKLRTDDAMEWHYGGGKDQDMITGPDGRLTGIRSATGGGVCVAKRLPPPLPEEVHRLLRDEKVFTNRSDVDKVADLYRSFFEAVTADARELDLSGLGWGDGEAAALAAALPSFVAVRSLSTAHNSIGGGGTRHLALAITAMGSLTKISVRSNALGDEGAIILCDALRESTVTTKVEELDLSANGISPVGAKAIAAFCTVSGSLTSLSLGSNELGDEGAIPIARALKESKVSKLASLDLNGDFSNKKIGPAGAKELAGYLSVSASLTKLSVSANNLGEKGTKVICDALQTNKTLKELDLSGDIFEGSNIGGLAGARHVAGMLGVNASLTSLDLRRNGLGPEGAAALAPAIAVSTSLTKLSVARNQLGKEGTQAICNALQTNKTLKELELSGGNDSNIGGSAGAVHVADMLRVNGSLTKLNVSWNILGDKGAAALREAVAGREGFHLQI